MTDETQNEKNILVIDDELGLREGCRRVLSRYGYQVDVAATGREGLSKVQQNHFGVVLIDVMMPDISGIELLSDILAHNPDTVCMIITGYATVELAVQAMKLGAYDFIAKPFSDDYLLLAVEKGLEKRRLEQEAQRVEAMEEETQRLTQETAMLVELDKVKSAFMRKVAHELRAPVAAISSLLTAVLEGYASPAKTKEIQQRAADRANELLGLIEDLLNLARLKDVKFAVRQDKVFVDDVLTDVLGLHRPEAEAKAIRLAVDARSVRPILADPAHIKQLWTNLISNAIKYTPSGGQVAVRLYAEGGWLVGQVQDTGIGIAKEDQPRLFEEFFRTDQAKAFARHGTGLGLAIAKQIVEQYGGHITVESELGKGTKVTFRLPQ
jgi:two-component system, sensor histidine kinase and response regulator